MRQLIFCRENFVALHVLRIRRIQLPLTLAPPPFPELMSMLVRFLFDLLMLIKTITLTIALLSASVESANSKSQTFDEYVNAIRKTVHAPIVEDSKNTGESSSSMLEVENLKKPLTVSQFSEWLHNLYYDEEKKRQSAIKYMLENQLGKPQE